MDQLSLPEPLSLEEYDECGKLESKLYVVLVVFLKYVLALHTQHGCTGKENDVGQPMIRLGF